jgi:hypothetical protein
MTVHRAYAKSRGVPARLVVPRVGVRVPPTRPVVLPHRRRVVSSKAMTRMIYRAIILATTGFASLDLYLLLTTAHH